MTSYGTQSNYSDQRFAAVDGNVGDFPPLYSDLPFSRRRKYGRNSDKDAIKLAMRCVLASPVLVLCLWTVGAFVFANKHVGNNTSARLMKRQAQMQSPQMLMLPQQQQPMQPQVMMMASPQGAQPLQMQQEQPQMQQQAQPIMMMSQQQVQPMQQTQEAAQPVMQQTEQEPVMQQTMQEQPVMQRTKKTKNQRSGAMNQRPLPRNPSQPQQPLAIQQQQPRQQILYYEPSHAMANGKLEAPMIVYDLNGNPIPLQSLRGAQIYMEPPKQQVQAPLKGMSTQDIQKWGESTAQDQSIIVATVAVMALLVGAISARRMRSRNILSSCIENEALEDDVAYDTAYTTTNKDNSYYNTFASGGWKGDLEKFDV